MSSPSSTRNLYNLNDRSFLVDMGAQGNWEIAARPEGAPWGVTVIEDRIVKVDLGDDKFEDKTVPASEFVRDIVSRYSGYGVFMAENDDKPTAEEVAQAEKEFELADMALIAEGHQIWDSTHNRSKIGQQRREAARRRKQTVEWSDNRVVDSKECPFCGELVRATAIKCKHCSEWLDGRAKQAPAEGNAIPDPKFLVEVGARRK